MAIVLQVSDTHLRAHDEGGPTSPSSCVAAALAAARAAGVEPDLIVHTGDLADDGTVAACEGFARLLPSGGPPVLAVAGNHDLPDALAAVFGAAGPVTLGAWRVVPLTTWLSGEIHGALDVPAALALLDEAPDRPTLAVMHHPPDSPSTNPMFGVVGAEAFLAALATRPWVRALATGHLHQDFDRVAGGVRVVGAPSTFYAMEHDGERWRGAADGAVGTRVWELGDDGSFRHRVVPR